MVFFFKNIFDEELMMKFLTKIFFAIIKSFKK